MKLFYRLRVWAKLLLRRFVLLNAFCKECGREVQDFIAPNDVWARVEPLIGRGKVLCCDCFCKKCWEAGICTTWRLVSE